MKQPTLFISRHSAYRNALNELNKRRRSGGIQVFSVSRFNNDTKEFERGFVARLTDALNPVFL